MERLRARRHDIVLMDVRLQGANGFEIIGRIRACDEASIGAIPILVLTADRSEALDRQFASSGADALESKPLGREDLRAAIARAFNGRTRPRRAAPSASPLAEVPVLDASVIAGHLSAIGADRTDRIVTAFLETARRHGPALRAAADAGDGSAISDIAHGLRSAGHMIGLHRLSEAAERVEARIASGCPPSCLVEAAEDLCLRLEEGSAALLELTGAK